MSHYTYINHIDILDKQFKPQFYSNTSIKDIDQKIRDQRLDIIVHCLKSKTESSFTIPFMCRCLVSLYEDKYKAELEERVKSENGNIWFCGWGYTRGCDFDKDFTLNKMIEELTILTKVVDTPDYFDECERFFEKKQAIEDAIDVEEILIEIINHELIDFYGTCEEPEKDLKDELYNPKVPDEIDSSSKEVSQCRCAICNNESCDECTGCKNPECINTECLCRK